MTDEKATHMPTERRITIEPHRIVGRLWLVKLGEHGHGGNKWVPYIGTDPTGFCARRLAVALQRSARRRTAEGK